MREIFLGRGKDFLKCPLMDLDPIDLQLLGIISIEGNFVHVLLCLENILSGPSTLKTSRPRWLKVHPLPLEMAVNEQLTERK